MAATASGYCYSRFKVVLAFALAVAVVSDGEIDVDGSDFKFDFLPLAPARASPSILLGRYLWPECDAVYSNILPVTLAGK